MGRVLGVFAEVSWDGKITITTNMHVMGFETVTLIIICLFIIRTCRSELGFQRKTRINVNLRGSHARADTGVDSKVHNIDEQRRVKKSHNETFNKRKTVWLYQA